MVLQSAPKSSTIFGKTLPNSIVTVQVGNHSLETKADSNGTWLQHIPPIQASFKPFEIQVESSSGEHTLLKDVLFGNVYFCSGQSNMQFTVWQSFNASAEIEAANRYSNIRVMTASRNPFNTSQSENTPLFGWSKASAASIGGDENSRRWGQFSAACWFFGRDLYEMVNLPIGLISANHGNTFIETWVSSTVLSKCNDTFHGEEDYNRPSSLWNGIIFPFSKMTITSVIWWQGEHNCRSPKLYECTFTELVKDWRRNWISDFRFVYTQLAPFILDYREILPRFRQSQRVVERLDNVQGVTAIDTGDVGQEGGNVHSRYKQFVGRRYALIAAALDYGLDVQYRGPQAVGISTINNATVVKFDDNSVGFGLELRNASCLPGIPTENCSEFEVFADGKWLNQQPIVVGNTLVFGNVRRVRYGWNNYPIVSLYNKNGLPAWPFNLSLD